LQSIMNHIYPAIENVPKDTHEDDLLNSAIKANINYQVEDLIKKDDYLAGKIKSGDIMLLGAEYSLATGKVEFLSAGIQA